MAFTSRFRTRRIVLTATIAAVVSASGFGGGEAAAGVQFRGISVEQQAIAHWAMGLFSEARLELPPVLFVAGPDPHSCEGFDFLAEPKPGHVQITICAGNAGPAGELLILHEVAHAWDFHNLTAEDRAGFQAHRRAETWLDRDVPWHERGGEQAAEILVWGLLDRPLEPVRISANACADLQAGYEILTGQKPLHGFTDYC